MLAKSALATRASRSNGAKLDPAFCDAKLTTARFYMEALLPRAIAHCAGVTQGADSTLALSEAQF